MSHRMSSNGKRSYEYDDQSRSRGVRGKGMDYCQGQQQQQQQHHPAGGRRANDQPSTSTSVIVVNTYLCNKFQNGIVSRTQMCYQTQVIQTV